MRRIITLAVLLAIIIYPMPSTEQNVGAHVRAWVYKKLGIDPKIAQRFSAPRGSDDYTTGSLLMTVDLSDQREHLLWDCGSCWAPAIANSNDVAVLTPRGIWVVAETGTPKLVVKAERLIDILGQIEGQPNHLLVLRAHDLTSSKCYSELQIADLASGTLRSISDIDGGCIEKGEGFARRDQISGTRKLGSTSRVDPLGPSRQLLVEDFAITPPAGRPLTPILDRRDPTKDRFEPIWRGPHTVVYLSNTN